MTSDHTTPRCEIADRAAEGQSLNAETTNCECCGRAVAPADAFLTEDDVLLCAECRDNLEDCINAGA
jgi:hypothetical protein